MSCFPPRCYFILFFFLLPFIFSLHLFFVSICFDGWWKSCCNGEWCRGCRESHLEHESPLCRFEKEANWKPVLSSHGLSLRKHRVLFEFHGSVLSSQSKFAQLWFWKLNLGKISVILWSSLLLWFWKTSLDISRGKEGVVSISAQQVSVGYVTVGLLIGTWNVKDCVMAAIRHHHRFCFWGFIL